MLHGFHRSLSKRPSFLGPFFPVCHYHQNQKFLVPSDAVIQKDALDFFDILLQQSPGVHQLKKLHAQAILTGLHRSGFLAARFIAGYSSISLLEDARSVFFTCVDVSSSLILWNSILRANLSHGCCTEAFRIYRQMRVLGIILDGFSFPLVIKAIASIGSPKMCKIIHWHAIVMGFQFHLHVTNELIGMYAKIAQMGFACSLLNCMPRRNAVSWNVIISGYSANYDCDAAFEMFEKMKLEDGLKPNLVTWTSLLSAFARCGKNSRVMELFEDMKAEIAPNPEALAVVLSVCGDLSILEKGKVIHGYIIMKGFEDYLFVKNSLIFMYGKHGLKREAQTLLSESKFNNIVSWNALISGYASAGLCDDALEAFWKLQEQGAESTMKPNVVSWSAVINGLATNGRGNASLELFRQMQHVGVVPNSVTIATALSVCAELAALNFGKEIHGHVMRTLMSPNILVENGLLHMYAKCGSLRDGHLIFAQMKNRDLISWNSMISGYGMHGFVGDALSTTQQMNEAGFRPDGITFVSLLSACSHSGLVADGQRLYDQMVREYKITPQLEHYACMVDLLGRAGLLQEAIEFIRKMPMKPNMCIWGSLLHSCRIHKNMDLAEESFRSFGIESNMIGSYMLLSNAYATCERWEDSAKARALTKTKGLKKSPGQSWIEVKKRIHMFSAGNLFLSGLEEVYEVLEYLGMHMEANGHIPAPDGRFTFLGSDEE